MAHGAVRIIINFTLENFQSERPSDSLHRHGKLLQRIPELSLLRLRPLDRDGIELSRVGNTRLELKRFDPLIGVNMSESIIHKPVDNEFSVEA